MYSYYLFLSKNIVQRQIMESLFQKFKKTVLYDKKCCNGYDAEPAYLYKQHDDELPES